MCYHLLKRKLINYLALFLSTAATFLVFFCIIWLFFLLITEGGGDLNKAVFTAMTPTVGGTGGLANAIVGSLLLSSTALLWGTPIGILAGIFLCEYQVEEGMLARFLRFIIDILLSTPTIIIGLFVYQFYVVPLQHFSGWAGSLALGLISIPIIARTTETIYRLVPASLRESVLALGSPHWYLICFLLRRVIGAGITTGILLALSRIIGEAAPLLFTALNNQFWSLDMSQPMANLPVTIFNFAMSPYPDWQRLAWVGALLISSWVLLINLLVRLLIRTHKTGFH